MASKKKLLKKLAKFAGALHGLRGENNKLHAQIRQLNDDIRVLIKGEAHGRIMSIKGRVEIEDSLEKMVWHGNPTRTNFGNGILFQIQNCSEYEEMKQVDSDNIINFFKEFKKSVWPSSPLLEKFIYKRPDEIGFVDEIPAGANPSNYQTWEMQIESFENLTNKTENHGLKKEEEKKEGTVPE